MFHVEQFQQRGRRQSRRVRLPVRPGRASGRKPDQAPAGRPIAKAVDTAAGA
jgi:hypothetical protein